MVDESEDIQVQRVDITLYLQNILFSHFVAAGVFDDRHRTVQLIQLQVMIDVQAFARFYMVEHEALLNFSYVQHIGKPPF